MYILLVYNQTRGVFEEVYEDGKLVRSEDYDGLFILLNKYAARGHQVSYRYAGKRRKAVK